MYASSTSYPSVLKFQSNFEQYEYISECAQYMFFIIMSTCTGLVLACTIMHPCYKYICVVAGHILLCVVVASALSAAIAIHIIHWWTVLLIFTYADDIHEAIHAIADLEKQVLTLPFC